MVDYNKLKVIYGGKLQKEDLFYALYMYQQHGGDTIYHDIRNALIEIYNLPPKDTTTLYLIKELDRTRLADYARLKKQNK